MVGFLPAGHPDPDRFVVTVAACFEAGMAALEVGVATDLAPNDGRIVRAAFAGRDLSWHRQCELAAATTAHGPVVAMTLAAGRDHAALRERLPDLTAAGVESVLVPDLPIADQLELVATAPLPIGVFVADRRDLTTVVTAADRRVPRFVYLRSSASHTGQPMDRERTGVRIRDTRRALHGTGADIPAIVGFGIHGIDEVDHVLGAGASAAVVGTRLVRAASDGPERAGELIRGLVSGTEDPR